MKKLFKKRRTYKRLNKKHFDMRFTERKMFFEDIEEIKENYKKIINNEKDYINFGAWHYIIFERKLNNFKVSK